MKDTSLEDMAISLKMTEKTIIKRWSHKIDIATLNDAVDIDEFILQDGSSLMVERCNDGFWMDIYRFRESRFIISGKDSNAGLHKSGPLREGVVRKALKRLIEKFENVNFDSN